MIYLNPRFVMNSSAPNHLTKTFDNGIKIDGDIIEHRFYSKYKNTFFLIWFIKNKCIYSLFIF